MDKVGLELPIEKRLLRPLDAGDLRLGQHLLNEIGKQVSYDGDGEAGMIAMLAIYIRHRQLSGDLTAASRILNAAAALAPTLQFRSIRDIIADEGGVQAINEAMSDES